MVAAAAVDGLERTGKAVTDVEPGVDVPDCSCCCHAAEERNSRSIANCGETSSTPMNGDSEPAIRDEMIAVILISD